MSDDQRVCQCEVYETCAKCQGTSRDASAALKGQAMSDDLGAFGRRAQAIIDAHPLFDVPKNEMVDVLRGLLAALASERTARKQTLLLQTIDHARRGIPPVECHSRCLYTQVRTCKQIYPDDTDMWCGFCSETNLIPANESPSEPSHE
jgi:hypothetical protein